MEFSKQLFYQDMITIKCVVFLRRTYMYLWGHEARIDNIKVSWTTRIVVFAFITMPWIGIGLFHILHFLSSDDTNKKWDLINPYFYHFDNKPPKNMRASVEQKCFVEQKWISCRVIMFHRCSRDRIAHMFMDDRGGEEGKGGLSL